jgi:hypothetical protein
LSTRLAHPRSAIAGSLRRPTCLLARRFTTAHVIWELIATPVAEDRCDFANNVWVHTKEKYEQYLAEKGITYERAKANFQAAVDAHNAEETPLFAKSIERKALGLKR